MPWRETDPFRVVRPCCGAELPWPEAGMLPNGWMRLPHRPDCPGHPRLRYEAMARYFYDRAVERAAHRVVLARATAV